MLRALFFLTLRIDRIFNKVHFIYIIFFLIDVSIVKDKGAVMEIKFKRDYKSLTIYIYGELDECSASSAKNILDRVLMDNLNSEKVIFDLSGLSFMDSTGIGLLIGRYKKLKQFSISSYISGASISTEKVIELAGLYSIMPKC